MSIAVEGRNLPTRTFRRRVQQRLFRAVASLAMLMVVQTGCVLAETSYPPSVNDLIPAARVVAPAGRTTRQWMVDAHERFRHLLPEDPEPLLTDDLTGLNRPPTDVWEHFDRTPESFNRVVANWGGMLQSAQSGGRPYQQYDPTEAWPGFEDIEFQPPNGEEIAGRAGWARDPNGVIIPADCIILMPGIYGHNLTLRTRDMAMALRSAGFHVFAMEPRGHGRTNARHPDLAFTFGVLETCDLLVAADWLERLPHVKETGAMGHSWGANNALLAAWYQDRLPNDPDIGPELARHMPAIPPGRHLKAGVIAASCIPRFEDVLDQLETPRSVFADPGLNNIQNTVRRRMQDRGSSDESGSLRKLIAFEFSRSALNYPTSVDDGLRFLRWMPHKDQAVGPKLEQFKVPVLIVHSGNDPLIPVADAADLLKGVKNPKVAALIMAGGGHVGYLPYARQYMFNLVVDFFATHGGSIERQPAQTRPATLARISASQS